eukprot:11160556-Lingulodinium_polyedra.AAC.1
MIRQHLETSGIPPTLQAVGASVCRMMMGTIACVAVATDSGVESSIMRRRRPREARGNTAEG